MYSISNQQRDELLKMLNALRGLQDNGDLRIVNLKRRAAILGRKLERKQTINQTNK